MTITDQHILLGVTSYNDAHALKRQLAGHAIDVTLMHNQQTCGGCSVKLEIWCRAADVEAIQRIQSSQRHAELSAMGYDPALADHVFDPSQAQAVCPACGTQFATAQRECPECGLCFALPDEGAKSSCGSC